jgi:aminopeptidase N
MTPPRRPRGVRRIGVPALSLALCLLGLAPGGAAAHAGTPGPGAAGLGDRLFPTLGNGGYDARHYRLSLTYPTGEPEQTVVGEVAMVAVATQALSSFNLDFAGDSVRSVRVNGRSASWTRAGEELVVTPRFAIRPGGRFSAQVAFSSGPFTPAPGNPFPIGWFTTRDGSITLAQPDKAHTIFPVNDHPADKATYDFAIDVPEGTVAVASGELRREHRGGGRVTYRYEMDDPLAAEVVQIAVGDLTVVDRGRLRGVELRDAAASTVADAVERALARTPDHLRWLSERVGRYPFDTYGVLAADRAFRFILETQTLSVHPADLLQPPSPPFVYEPIMVHELAHQWFGNSVAPESWSDLWLSEGHATWYEWLYSDEFFADEVPALRFVARVREAYTHGDEWRAAFGPVALPKSSNQFLLFSPNVYDGGATVLYALRQVIGARAFGELQRRWAQRYEGESVGTDEFIALASRVAHRDLVPFLREWLYGTETPPMPGHPDWTVPAEQAPPSGAAAAGAT